LAAASIKIKFEIKVSERRRLTPNRKYFLYYISSIVCTCVAMY